MEQSLFKLSGVFDMIEVKVSDHYNHAYKSHLHSSLSIGIIEKGCTVLNVNGIDYEMCEGDAVVIDPYISHICKPVDLDEWAFTMIYIDKSFYSTHLKWSVGENLVGIVKLGQPVFEKIKVLIHTLKTAHIDFDREVELVDTLNLILESCDVLVERSATEQSLAVRQYIYEHFLEVLQLDSLEKQFNLNKFTLIRQFKKAYNTTPSAYQLQLKVAYSKELLESHDDLLSVALNAGFYDQAHFNREFKKSTGVSPNKYRQALNPTSISYNTSNQQ